MGALFEKNMWAYQQDQNERPNSHHTLYKLRNFLMFAYEKLVHRVGAYFRLVCSEIFPYFY